MNRLSVLIPACLALILSLAGQAQVPLSDEPHVDATLVAETSAAVPGQPLWVALRLVHEERWHTYWKNPGDAGMPTTISWDLPEGVTAGEIIWPLPRRFDLPADLVDFGYEEEVFLLTEITVPTDFSAASLDLDAAVRWLECIDTTCIPRNADLDLSLPVQDSAAVDERWTAGFASTRADQPQENESIDSSFSLVDGEISLLVQATEPLFEDVSSVTFFPGEHRVFNYLDEARIDWQVSSLQLVQQARSGIENRVPERITGVLVVEEGSGERTIYDLDADAALVDLGASPVELEPVVSPLPLATVFAFALLGGLILNLMPCVLPVLSLKVVSVVESAGTSRREQRLHALVYTAGVIASFLVLASLLLALQASGAAIGWGFHMQSPVFVSALICLFLVMGLSMSGVIEVGTGLMGVGSNLSLQSGYKGSFFTGVLTCVVASPCTAPFMGAALAVAFTQPPVIGLTIFAALGLGVALPFLLIAYIPALARLMPKPGHWMVTFKHVMAVPLYGALLWMLWVLYRQTGIGGMLAILAVALGLSASLWLMQKDRMTRDTSGFVTRGGVLAVLIVLVGVGLTRSPLLESRSIDFSGGIAEPFTQARLDALRAEGRPVFVNMTASWCIPCLVNEKVALGTEAFEQALQANGVVYLKGDWTNNDPEITAVLKRYNTGGVPLYLMFPAETGATPEVLPQILTEGILLDALERL